MGGQCQECKDVFWLHRKEMDLDIALPAALHRIRELEAELTDADRKQAAIAERCERMHGALNRCAEIFRDYAQIHAEKVYVSEPVLSDRSREALAKYDRNKAYEEMAREALKR